jgi:phage-related protein
MPEAVREEFGAALYEVRAGQTPADARPFGEGVPRAVFKLVEHFDGETYRAAYTTVFDGGVYVLDVFQKKSTSGHATPRPIVARVLARFRAAKVHYEDNPPTADQ